MGNYSCIILSPRPLLQKYTPCPSLKWKPIALTEVSEGNEKRKTRTDYNQLTPKWQKILLLEDLEPHYMLTVMH